MFIALDHDISLEEMKKQVPADESLKKVDHDNDIINILTGKSDRILAIVGPCSAHDPAAVKEYFELLSECQRRVPYVKIVGRVYTDKPRTVVTTDSYKGICSADGYRRGILTARQMMVDCLKTGLPVANELLYPDEIDYYDDLVSYWAIGARCSESQGHRLVASGIDVPVGIKNPTDGSLKKMVDGVESALQPQVFMHRGHPVSTSGNKWAHSILRGGNVPNYHYEDMISVYEECKSRNLPMNGIIVDCNHSNSRKDYKLQRKIAKDVIRNKFDSNRLLNFVKGVMVESFIVDGNGGHVFGQSITDPCLNVQSTIELLRDLNEIVRVNQSKLKNGVCHD